jgi:hypothetical protein
VVLLAGAGVGLTVVLTRGDADDDARRSGPDLAVIAAGSLDGTATLLSEPTDEWTLDFDDLIPGGTAWEGYESEGGFFPIGDVLFIELRSSSEETDEEIALLAGVDAATGEVLWQDESTSYGSTCFPLPESGAVICNGNEWRPARALDVRTGEQIAVFDHGFEAVEYAGGVVYGAWYAGVDDLHSVQVAALDPDDLSETWSVRAEDPGPNLDEGNEFDGGIGIRPEGTDLVVEYGYLTWVLDPATGVVREQSQDYEFAAPGEDYTLDYGGDDEQLIQDRFGNTLVSGDGTPWSGVDRREYPAVVQGRVGLGSALYDVATGAQLWSRDDLAEIDEYGDDLTSWSWTPDVERVLAGSAWHEGEVSLVDTTDGSTVWTIPAGFWPDSATYTDDAVAYATSDAVLTVRSTDADGVAWTRPLDAITVWDADSEPSYRVDRVADTLVVHSYTGLAGYTGFTDQPSEAVADLVDVGTDDTDDGTDGGTDYATDCGSAPIFTPLAAADAYGGVTVTYTVTAVCNGGQWLHGSAVGVTLGTGGSTYASGTFDYSGAPVWVPDDGVGVVLTYPYETTYATAGEIQQAIDEEAADGDPANHSVIHVDCVDLPTSIGGAVPASPADGADGAAPLTADGAAQEPAAVEESALEALRRIAAADDAAVSADLEDWWLPQLSSKVEGTTDDGIVYTYEDILSEHLRLRSRYPDVRLVNSADWGSFQVAGYWVTVVGSTSTRPGPALAWCGEQYLDADHCYAKRLRRGGPPDGNTRHQT